MEGQSLPLPPQIVKKIVAKDGNSKCIDCGADEPDWGDVLHGSLHCIQCAGRHRSLGVSVSFCKSLTLDDWTERSLLSMLVGGNAQLKLFFQKQKIENSDVETLYQTRQAQFYREQLSAQVDKMLDKRNSSSSSSSSSGKRSPRMAKKATPPLLAHDFLVKIEGPSLGASLSRALPPMGMALDPSVGRGNGSVALVTKVVSSGPAMLSGVRVGDYVVAIDGRPVRDYDELMELFGKESRRPLTLTVRRWTQAGSESTEDQEEEDLPSPPPSNSSDNEGTSSNYDVILDKLETPKPPADKEEEEEEDADPLEFQVTFQAGPLGMRLEEREGLVPLTVVTSVEHGGQAASLGIKVGCVIRGLKGDEYLSYAHTVATLKHSKRPIDVRLRYND